MKVLLATMSLLVMGWSTASPALAANATDLRPRVTSVSFRNGAVGTYTVTVSNNGPATTNDVITVVVSLPNGFSLLSSSGGEFACTASGQTVSCARSSALSSGSTATFTLRVNVCSTVTRVSTTIAISYANDTNTANNQTSRATSVRLGPCQPTPTPTRTSTSPPATPTSAATATAAGPTSTRTNSPTPTASPSPIPAATDLSLTKTVLGAFRVGSNGSYFLVVTNNGPLATNIPIVISDPLPNGMSFVTASGAGWSCGAIARNVSCTYAAPLTSLSNTSVTITVAVGIAASPTVTNVATVDYPGDTDTSNNTARRPTTIRN